MKYEWIDEYLMSKAITRRGLELSSLRYGV